LGPTIARFGRRVPFPEVSMRRRTTLALSLVALTGGFGLLLVRGAGAADPVATGAGRTAVVDVVALLNASPRKKIIEANNLAQKQSIEKYADAEQQKMGEMRKQIMLMPEADPGRRKLETDYAREKVLAEFDLKMKVAEAESLYSDALEGLYEEVKGTVREIAEQQGFAIVLNLVKDRLDLRNSPGGFVANIAARPVLYASDALDITSLVKARLEQKLPPSPVVPGPVRPPTPAPGAPAPLPAPSSPGSIPPPSVPGMR